MAARIDIDTAMQGWFDRLIGSLEGYGITYPAVLRECLTALWLSTLLTAFAASWVDSTLLSVFFFTFSGLLLGFYGKNWLRYNADARRDWTPILAEKYAKESLKARERSSRRRAFDLLGLLIMGLVGALAVALGVSPEVWPKFVPLFSAVMLRQIVAVVWNYVESAIPLPPPPRKVAMAGV